MVSRTLALAGLLQGLWCAAGQHEDIDFETTELWPLSGGVADGVNVELSAKGLNDEGLAAIDFLTADYQVAFRFAFDSQAQVIRRTCLQNPEVTYGGWPLSNNTAPLTVNFLMTPNHWAVTINGARMAWFDFPHQIDTTVVQAAVHSGIKEGWVVDERPTCMTECHPEECLGSDGNFRCGGVSNPPTPCFARTPLTDPGTARCTTDRTTGPAGMHCCDGRQQEKISFEESSLGSWFQVHADLNVVESACASFGSDMEGNVERCVASAGQKLSPRSINPHNPLALSPGSGTFRAWVPSQSIGSNQMQMIDIPADVLATTVQQSKNISIGGMNVATKFRVDNRHALVTQVQDDAKQAGLEEFWFLNMFKINLPATGDWWMSYSDRTWPSVRRMGTLDLYLVDEDVGHTACTDDPQFKDREGNGCDTYIAGAWCEDHGLSTDNFREAHPGIRNIDELSNTTGWHAIYMCCLCGGGFHEDPRNTAAALLLQ